MFVFFTNKTFSGYCSIYIITKYYGDPKITVPAGTDPALAVGIQKY
jgi:hypothetical protein